MQRPVRAPWKAHPELDQIRVALQRIPMHRTLSMPPLTLQPACERVSAVIDPRDVHQGMFWNIVGH